MKRIHRKVRKRSADSTGVKQASTREGRFFGAEGEASFFNPSANLYFKHVSQQVGAPTVQRAPDDKHDLTSTALSGDSDLEKCFDAELVIKKPANGPHVKKLQEALISLGIPLPKFGADADYGTETLTAVQKFQQKAGMSENEWDGRVGRKTIGLMDMSLRNNNTVSKDEDKSTDDFVVKDPKLKDESCKGKAKDAPCPDPNPEVDEAADAATRLIDTTEKQLPPEKTDNADYPAIFAQLFRNNDSRELSETVKDVKGHYASIKNFLGELKKDKSHVRCGTACDGGCKSGSPAYHNHAGGKHIITFCPNFKSFPQRILVILHECHHAAVNGSSDVAYADTRLIDKLDHTKALLNAASFHLYSALVEKPGSETIGPKVKDTVTLGDASQKKNAELTLAFMEQWFRLVTFDMSIVSVAMEDARANGRYSSPRGVDMINRIYAKWFGVLPAPARPRNEDVQKAKAIEERSSAMSKAFRSPLTITDSKDVSLWDRGPGSKLKLNSQLLKLDNQHMAIALLQQLVQATPGISAESEPLYVGLINDLRNDRSLDP
jgi:hypothetical protein